MNLDCIVKTLSMKFYFQQFYIKISIFSNPIFTTGKKAVSLALATKTSSVTDTTTARLISALAITHVIQMPTAPISTSAHVNQASVRGRKNHQFFKIESDKI